jgi:hypothetical protein
LATPLLLDSLRAVVPEVGAAAADRARADPPAFRAARRPLVATFAPDGRLLRFDAEAEADGDLGTPHHGSGEHVARDGYELSQGRMIPKRFVVARAAAGRILPFWEGRVTQIRFVAGT